MGEGADAERRHAGDAVSEQHEEEEEESDGLGALLTWLECHPNSSCPVWPRSCGSWEHVCSQCLMLYPLVKLPCRGLQCHLGYYAGSWPVRATPLSCAAQGVML